MNDLIIGAGLGATLTLLLVSFFWPKKPLQLPSQNPDVVSKEKLRKYVIEEAELTNKLMRTVKMDDEWGYHLKGHYEGQMIVYAGIADEFIGYDEANYIDHL